MFQVETGHAAICVCGSCSSIRQECQWPDSDRWGHNWLPVRANLLRCDHCGQEAVFSIREIKEGAENLIATVHLLGRPDA